MNYKFPEECGISSVAIEKFVRALEENHLFTHDIIIAKGDDIIFENYWAPFHKDFLHRLYSVSKSFVSIAVGFAEQDGFVNLDDPISKYFPEEAACATNELMKTQTVRHMLMMSTTVEAENWFEKRHPDRIKLYFENPKTDRRPDGTVYNYDSTGSFVLGAMVEKVTGKPLMEYLRDKLFRKIGVSEEATCLVSPGGYSWGDSACLTTARDLLLVARFMLNGGKWNGEQILNEEYVKAAVSKQIDNNVDCVYSFDTQDYGYLIWRTYDESWFFNGMGCQFAIAVPHLDLIMVYNGDNQGNIIAKKVIFDNFFDIIVRPEHNLRCPQKAQTSLSEYAKSLKLGVMWGNTESDFAEKISGKTFELKNNKMDIKYVKVTINGNEGVFEYENKTGKKSFGFGFGKNVFGEFPEEGYSDKVGSQSAPGNFYKCAVSAAWVEPQKIFLHVQAIDDYFGKLNITLGWRDEKTLGIYMSKTAEDFFDEYSGYAEGYAE